MPCCCLFTKLCLTFCDPVGYIACHTALSMGFSRLEYRSGVLFPPPGDLPDPRIELKFLCLLHWQLGSFPLSPREAISCLALISLFSSKRTKTDSGAKWLGSETVILNTDVGPHGGYFLPPALG